MENPIGEFTDVHSGELPCLVLLWKTWVEENFLQNLGASLEEHGEEWESIVSLLCFLYLLLGDLQLWIFFKRLLESSLALLLLASAAKAQGA